MTRNVLRTGTAVAFLLAFGELAVAQVPTQVQPAPPAGAAPAPPAGAVHTFRAKDVIGSKVNIQGNTSVGTVDDIVFDDSGNLEYLIVSDNGKLVTVPWQAAVFNVQQKVAVVNVTPEQYKVIPTYTPTTYPAYFTPEYRTQVYKWYNLTPGQLRRIERRLP